MRGPGGHGGPMGGRGGGPMGGHGGPAGGHGGPMGGPGGPMGGRPPMPPRRPHRFGGYGRGCGCLPGCMMYVLGIGAIVAFILSLIF